MEKSSLRSEHLNSIYAELANLVGMEITLKIHEHYNGQQITFPSRLFAKSYVEAEIVRRYDGTNIKALAREFGFTERWARTVAKRNQKNKQRRKGV